MKRTRRMMAMLLAFLMVLANIPASAVAVDGADGTKVNEDGYIEVRTIEDLYNIRNDLTANYILMNDIDLTEATAKGGDWDYDGRGWNPIGSKDNYANAVFSGIFDGNGYSIIGMRIYASSLPSGTFSSSCAGLFAHVKGTVRSLTMKNVNISIGCTHIGAIAGMVGDTGIIENCSVSGCIKRGSLAGGIAGSSDGTISACFNLASVSGSGDVGGIVGVNYGTIVNCYNAGDITNTITNYSERYAGGIAGENGGSSNYAAKIKHCYSVGTVASSYGTASAVAIANNSSKASITQTYYRAGAGVGASGATALTEAQLKLQTPYSGFDFDTVWCIDADAVYPYPQLQSNVQDLRVPVSLELVSVPYKLLYAWGEPLDMTGCKIKLVCKDSEEELRATEDMVTGFDATIPGEQMLTITYLGLTTTLTVTVKPKEYIPVYTVEDLYNIRNDLDADYILMNDIDLTEATAKGGDWDFMGNGWNPIGSNDVYGNDAFTGEFDGNGHKIIGMRIEVTTYPAGIGSRACFGLFANVSGSVHDITFVGGMVYCESVEGNRYAGAVAGTSSATIYNVINNMELVRTKGAYRNYNASAGGIVGESTGEISNCRNYSNVTSYIYTGKDPTIVGSYEGWAGGIAGQTTQPIRNCFNTGNIKAFGTDNYTSTSNKNTIVSGGIAGTTSSQIVNCYNTGTITTLFKETEYYSGGICGKGTAENCYNVGIAYYAISPTDSTNCYYIYGSGESSTGATALTETQMKLQAMYAGFDFENVWVLNEYANHPYPQLRSNVQDLNESAAIVSVISWPAKQVYYTGDQLALDGCTMKVTYVSGREEVLSVTADMISGFDTNTPGEQTLTVTYRGGTDTFPVTVVERPTVTAIELISEPNTTEFGVGMVFDFTGAQIKVFYEGGATEIVDVTLDMTTGGNIHHLGKQTITVSYYGQSATFEVTVTPVTIESLELQNLPAKLDYLEGEQLDLTGMVVLTVMNDGTKIPVNTGYSVSGYTGKPGTQTVTIGYLGKTTTFQVTVTAKSVVQLSLRSMPAKTEYVSGQSFDPKGMVVTATYDNGETLIVENFEISGFDDVPGLKTVVASFEGKHVAFPITVIARVITDFKITSCPAKLQYLQYDAFDPTGLEVQATYNDGITETVSDYTVVGFSSNPGTYTLSVTFGGWVDTFEITVSPRELVNLVVVAPSKTTYYLGEEFDASGLTVTAYYNNGQQMTVTDYTLSGFDSSTPGTKTITVSFGGKSSAFCVSVSKRSEIETNGSFIVDDLAGRLGETVRIPVTVTNNTGLAGLRHELHFNSKNLKFVGVEMKGDYSKGTLVVNDQLAEGILDADGKPTENGVVTVVWFSGYDVRTSGVVYELVFEIRETAADGVTKVELSFAENDNGNISGENLIFGVQNGGVEVLSWWLGDLNGDRKYAMVDLVMLAQYVSDMKMETNEKMLLAADVNEDGTIDIHDVVLLNQWLLEQDI